MVTCFFLVLQNRVCYSTFRAGRHVPLLDFSPTSNSIPIPSLYPLQGSALCIYAN